MIRPRNGFTYRTGFPTCWTLTVVLLDGSFFGLLDVDARHAKGYPYTAPMFHHTMDYGWRMTNDQVWAWLKKMKAKRIAAHLEVVEHLTPEAPTK